jgi:hypothetical protein
VVVGIVVAAGTVADGGDATVVDAGVLGRATAGVS